MLNLDSIVSNKNTSSSKDNNWPFRMLIIGPYSGPYSDFPNRLRKISKLIGDTG